MSVNYENLAKTVELAINGDANAIEQLYTDTYPSLYCIAMELMKNEHEAEDMVQESFHLIFMNLKNIPNVKYFIPWSKRILRNYCYRTLRHPHDSPSDQLESFMEEYIETSGDPIHTLLLEERNQHIQALLSNMDPVLRETVELKFYENLKVSEIAKRMNCPVGTVKSRLFKSRKVLRELIEKDKPFLALLSPILPLSLLMGKTSAKASGKSLIIGLSFTTAVGTGIYYSHNLAHNLLIETSSKEHITVVDDNGILSLPNIQILNHSIDGDKLTLLIGELYHMDNSNNTSSQETYFVSNVDFDGIYATTDTGDNVSPDFIDKNSGIVEFYNLTEALTIYIPDINGNNIKSRIYPE